jgi:carboxyl-terminal processing protease
MPRRNLTWLLLITVLSVACYHRALGNRYGRTLAEVLDHVSRRYYVPADDLDLFEGAMKGMVERLSDKNSSYIPPAKKRGFDETISHQFGGVGIELDPRPKQLTVLSPMAGEPAYEAGIRAGDKILKINGQSTQGMSQEDAVDRMRGRPGTPVTLSILHAGETQPVEFTIARKIIHMETVLGDTRNADGSWNYFLPGHDRIGYVRITGFADAERPDQSGAKLKTTVADFRDAIEQLTRGGVRGLVIDLRDNPGGSLPAAIGICNLLIPQWEWHGNAEQGEWERNVIVTTRGRNGRVLSSFEASNPAPLIDVPIAVLVDAQSASASEIVAACLQDHHRAIVVGQRTYGKGTVQEVMDLGEPFGELKLTIASFWRPSGRNIDRHGANGSAAWGVMPDEGYAVPLDEAERSRFHRWRQERDIARRVPGKAAALLSDAVKDFVDRPLAKAVEYLEKPREAE